MESKKMNIVYKKVKDLIPYENNPRNNDEAVDYVAKSIEEFGFKVPCVVSGDGVLITGHTRLKACKKLGIDEVPCIVAEVEVTSAEPVTTEPSFNSGVVFTAMSSSLHAVRHKPMTKAIIPYNILFFIVLLVL